MRQDTIHGAEFKKTRGVPFILSLASAAQKPAIQWPKPLSLEAWSLEYLSKLRSIEYITRLRT